MNEDKKILNSASEVLDEGLRGELNSQGHYLTGALQNATEHKVSQVPGVSSSHGYTLKYGLYLHYGVKATRIPFNPGSGAKSSKYIDGLTLYFRLRGLSEKEARSAAFATAKKHKKEGMPTQGSYAYSSNGRRTAFISEAGNSTNGKVKGIMNTGIEKMVSKQFNQTKSEIIT